MFERVTQQEDGERGQVGIGTLIVFIALVLVAAIAAGVLINTAGFLQTQAEATGQESTDQVSNNLDVVSGFGTADSTAGEVTSPNVVLQLAPGSDSINLDDVQVQIFLEDAATESSTIDAASLAGDGILDSGETVTIDLEADTGIAGGALTLQEGQTAEVVLITADGSQTETVLSAPAPIVDDGDVRL